MRNFDINKFREFAKEYGWRESILHVFKISNKDLGLDYVINTDVMAFIEYNETGSNLKDGLTVTELKALIKVFGNKVAE